MYHLCFAGCEANRTSGSHVQDLQVLRPSTVAADGCSCTHLSRKCWNRVTPTSNANCWSCIYQANNGLIDKNPEYKKADCECTLGASLCSGNDYLCDYCDSCADAITLALDLGYTSSGDRITTLNEKQDVCDTCTADGLCPWGYCDCLLADVVLGHVGHCCSWQYVSYFSTNPFVVACASYCVKGLVGVLRIVDVTILCSQRDAWFSAAVAQSKDMSTGACDDLLGFLVYFCEKGKVHIVTVRLYDVLRRLNTCVAVV